MLQLHFHPSVTATLATVASQDQIGVGDALTIDGCALDTGLYAFLAITFLPGLSFQFTLLTRCQTRESFLGWIDLQIGWVDLHIWVEWIGLVIVVIVIACGYITFLSAIDISRLSCMASLLLARGAATERDGVMMSESLVLADAITATTRLGYGIRLVHESLRKHGTHTARPRET